MSTSSMGANNPIEDAEATLLAATKSALDELVCVTDCAAIGTAKAGDARAHHVAMIGRWQ